MAFQSCLISLALATTKAESGVCQSAELESQRASRLLGQAARLADADCKAHIRARRGGGGDPVEEPECSPWIEVVATMA